MVFFFVFFFQMIVSVLYSVGIGGIYKKKFINIIICFSSNFYFFFRNGFKWTVAGIRSHRKKNRQWWPNFCWGSDGHNWGWMGTGSFGRFLSIGQGVYLTTISNTIDSGINVGPTFISFGFFFQALRFLNQKSEK